MSEEPIVVYTTPLCGDCRAVKRALDLKGLSYVEIDIVEDAEARALVEAVNGGRRSVPTLVHGDVAMSLSRFSLERLHAFLTATGHVAGG